MIATRNFDLGPFQIDDKCVAFYDDNGKIILESYAYENNFFRFNWHSSLEIMIVLKGRLKTCTERGMFDLEEDGVLIINPNIGHASMFKEQGTISLVLHISKEFLEKLLGNVFLPYFDLYVMDGKPDMTADFVRSSVATLYYSLATEQYPSKMICLAEIFSLCSVLLSKCSDRVLSPKTTVLTRKQSKMLDTMMKMVNRRFRERISLSDIASLLNMNPSYASTFFKTHVGMGFYDYLTKKRTAYAAYKLNTTDDIVSDIAIDSGFGDAKALHAAFRKFFDMTPGEYRNRLEEAAMVNDANNVPRRYSLEDELVLQKINAYARSGASLISLLEDKKQRE